MPRRQPGPYGSTGPLCSEQLGGEGLGGLRGSRVVVEGQQRQRWRAVILSLGSALTRKGSRTPHQPWANGMTTNQSIVQSSDCPTSMGLIPSQHPKTSEGGRSGRSNGNAIATSS